MESTSGGIISFIPLLVILLIIFYVLIKPIKNKSKRPINIEDKTRRNPGVSAVLSFLFPGLGQIYNGEISDGFRFIIINFIFIIFIIIGVLGRIPILLAITVILQFVFYCFNIIDARKSSIRINNAIENIRTSGSTCLEEDNLKGDQKGLQAAAATAEPILSPKGIAIMLGMLIFCIVATNLLIPFLNQ